MMVKIPHHLLALSAALVLILSLVLSSRVTDIGELYLWRVLAGLAGGCLMATVNAAIAQARSPTLLYGLSWAVGYAVTAILAVVITETSDLISFDIIYRYLAISIFLILPLLWLIPRHASEGAPAPLPRNSIGNGCLLMLGIIIISVSMMSYYAFLGQLALSIEASAGQIGWIVAIAQIGGIVGGLSAAPLASSLSVINALILTTILHVVAIAIAIWTDHVFVLAGAAFFEAVLFIIMTPLMFTLAAQIDKKGRWAAAAAGVFTLSTAFGPILGALLIENSGYAAIAWLQLLAAIMAIFIFVRVNKKTITTN